MKNNIASEKFGFSTRAIHAGQEPSPGVHAIMTPIYQTSTYVQTSPGVYSGYDYGRTNNPTRTALEENIAALERAKFGICFASGCAAIDAIMHLLVSGDHVVCCDDVYGGTFRLFENIFSKMGLSYSYVDLRSLEKLEAAITPQTKLIWVESPTNPLLKVIDIEMVSDVAQKNKLKVVVDNTFASPYLQNPLELGASLVLHSSTKYIGGHSDVIGGVVLVNDETLAERLYYIQNAVGAVPAPLDCFLLLRSTKTLAIRMESHCRNAQEIAEFLLRRDDIEKVIYPGLPSHPDYKVVTKQMRAGGGMVSFVVAGGESRARSFLEKVKLFSLAESLGGVESLIEHPAIMTHASIPQAVREKLGITGGFVRTSVGIEDVGDLISDLATALDASKRLS
ncbi:MAG: cystathionine gamma-synthase [Deltaproteobacteria bacterium]|nr:cystathionine gamma-synthase [Deltaproteobacteria bacterium]